MQELSSIELNQYLQEKESVALFVYTPMCGTCKLAARMLGIMQETLPTVPLYQININTAPILAEQWQVTSVPALLIFYKNQLLDRHYAIQSVGFLYDVLKPLA
ncbi:thioredoxin family protein [Brevibacillus sp. MER 51]|uniref:thioredoxin family protein n=1 Tax=Brevibacillus sp. MER 51 TaxID=2939560 RepID=UPI002040B6B0|nr:thioredoxin family protein [Brevibacillus sp. MER 51]MCM3141041.1 thioredoxin family protein [Brevibacillus sp. MER 51]